MFENVQAKIKIFYLNWTEFCRVSKKQSGCVLPTVNAQNARIKRMNDFASILNILCAIKHNQVSQFVTGIRLFEQFNNHLCNVSCIFLSSSSQVFGSVNNVHNNQAGIHVVADDRR